MVKKQPFMQIRMAARGVGFWFFVLLAISVVLGGRTKISLIARPYHFNVTFSNEDGPAEVHWTRSRGEGLAEQGYQLLATMESCEEGLGVVLGEGENIWGCGELLGPVEDTLKAIAGECEAGQIPKYNATEGRWYCARDLNSCPVLLQQADCPQGASGVVEWNAQEEGFECREDENSLAEQSCPVGQMLKAGLEGWECVEDRNEDTLRDLSCGVGKTPTFSEGRWGCTERCSDTLEDLHCSPGQIPVRGPEDGSWVCGFDATDDACLTFAETCRAGQALGVTESGSDISCVDDTGFIDCGRGQWPVFTRSNGVSRWVCGFDANSDTLPGVVCDPGQPLEWNAAGQNFVCGSDSDSFTGFSCTGANADGSILKKTTGGGGSSSWSCSPDLNDDTFFSINVTQCAAIAARGRQPILSYSPSSPSKWACTADCDTVGALGSCTGGQLAKWDSVRGGWTCGTDADALASAGCPFGSIVAFSSSSGWYCRSIGDALSALSCSNGQMAKYSSTSNSFVCGTDQDPNTLKTLGACGQGKVVKFSRLSPLGWVCAVDNNDDTLRDLDCGDGQVPVFQFAGKQWVCGSNIQDTNTLRDIGTCSAGQIPKVDSQGNWACADDEICSPVGSSVSDNPTVIINSGRTVLGNSFFYPVKDTALDWGGRVVVPPVMTYPGYVIGISGSLTRTGLATGANVTLTVTINSSPVDDSGRIVSLVISPGVSDNLVDTATLARNYIVFPSPIRFEAGDTVGYQISTNRAFAVGAPSTVDCQGSLFLTLANNNKRAVRYHVPTHRRSKVPDTE